MRGRVDCLAKILTTNVVQFRREIAAQSMRALVEGDAHDASRDRVRTRTSGCHGNCVNAPPAIPLRTLREFEPRMDTTAVVIPGSAAEPFPQSDASDLRLPG